MYILVKKSKQNSQYNAHHWGSTNQSPCSLLQYQTVSAGIAQWFLLSCSENLRGCYSIQNNIFKNGNSRSFRVHSSWSFANFSWIGWFIGQYCLPPSFAKAGFKMWPPSKCKNILIKTSINFSITILCTPFIVLFMPEPEARGIKGSIFGKLEKKLRWKKNYG